MRTEFIRAKNAQKGPSFVLNPSWKMDHFVSSSKESKLLQDTEFQDYLSQEKYLDKVSEGSHHGWRRYQHVSLFKGDWTVLLIWYNVMQKMGSNFFQVVLGCIQLFSGCDFGYMCYTSLVWLYAASTTVTHWAPTVDTNPHSRTGGQDVSRGWKVQVRCFQYQISWRMSRLQTDYSATEHKEACLP